jgi:hypothetical protein
LETANEMFKAAFIIKKIRFAHQNPGLTKHELLEMTAAYFRKLAESKSAW